MTLKQKKKVTTVVGAAGILVAILSRGSRGNILMMLMGLAMFLIGLLLDVIWIRCPHCGKRLGRYDRERCSHCGEGIDYDAKK